MFLVEGGFIAMCILYAAPFLAKFSTLGTVKFETVFDPLTMTQTVNDYDNSFLILLNSIISILMIVTFIFIWITNMKTVYRLQLKKQKGETIPTFLEDLISLGNKRFHITLLALPIVGVVLMNIIPIFVLIAIAFTNYD